MDYNILLDVAMPGPPEPVTKGFSWIIVFVIVAFVIAIASIIIIRKGLKKVKMEAEAATAIEATEAIEDKKEE